MPPPEKRPAPPAPDPNWELELHPPPGGAKKAPPESRDPMLAHALLQASEPDPLDLELDMLDEATDVERTTLPPPEAMSDHVARMMAEASLFEDADDTGDRPTPLVEVPSSLRGSPEGGPALTRDVRPAIREARPSQQRDGRHGLARARDSRPSSPRADVRDARDARQAPAREVRPAAPRDERKALPHVDRGRVAAAGPASAPPAAPARPPSWTSLPAAQPARPPSRTNVPAAQAPVRPPSRTNMPAAQPARPPSRTNMPATQQPVRPPSWTNMPASKGPSAAAAPAPDPRQRLDSLDFSDLPAVFAFDGLEMDEPAVGETTPRPVSAKPPPLPPDAPSFGPLTDDTWAEASPSPSALDPWSDPAITPMPEPWSEAAISPPFDSEDLRRSAPKDASSERVAAIEARIAAGDYGRALVLAEAALEEHPGDPAVSKHAESCRDELYKRYLERLGASDHVPRLAVQKGAITGLSLDHRAGFLLSCVDGGSTVEEIIDVSAMPRLDAVRILYELVQEGVIEMKTLR